MKSNHKKLDEMFHGDEELAKAILIETEKVKCSIEEISKMINDELSIDKSKKMIRALAESYGELVSGIILPIKFKYPNLDDT